MKFWHFFIYIFILLVSCNNEIEKPMWQNQKEIINVSEANFTFGSQESGWEASLQSFVQPIPVKVIEKENGFSVKIDSEIGVIEGPADLILRKNNQVFTYPFYLLNKKEDLIEKKDYRSPKTVNPDSVLVHQSIVFNIDKFRNIKYLVDKNSLFSERQISLPPKVMVKKAILNEPITSYYVQVGSATKIPIKGYFDFHFQHYRILAGPIFDSHLNLVSDGTLVRFEFESAIQNGLAEVGIKDGYAKILIPKSIAKSLSIKARIHLLTSKTIIIKSN